jgi:hypothetical protein
MSAATIPPATEMPCGPNSVDVEAIELRMVQRWDSGATHVAHLIENCDLPVIFKRGGGDGHTSLSANIEDTGVVVISLGVDGDHDEIHYVGGSEKRVQELVLEAIDALVVCRDALRKVHA